MHPHTRTKRRIEFGDFQTPLLLARQVCHVLAAQIPMPAAVVEPTCGRGSFLVAALESFPSLRNALGVDINAKHINAARLALASKSHGVNLEIRQCDFFSADWKTMLGLLPDPLLVLGNPPWVTNAAVGTLGGTNLPRKSNFQRHRGLDAITGKSNFDISEWMLIHLLEALTGRNAVLAMLCKSAAARKVLAHAWNHQILNRAEMRLIDAQKHFDASVDACLLVCQVGDSSSDPKADVFLSLTAEQPSYVIGLRDGRLAANLDLYERTRHLSNEGDCPWRSGIKHDCARVMEFRRVGGSFQNGLGELVELEEEYLYPVLKSSDVASGRVSAPRRWMLVTQKCIGDDTSSIEHRAPKTWRYLQRHADRLDRRASSIYRGRPRFSIFGVGEYTFARYKVAVSGLYKHLSFAIVGPYHGKPAVLDDTCAFFSCGNEAEAHFVCELLCSDLAQSFYAARIFWDAKRPITTGVLNQLNLTALAYKLEPAHPITGLWMNKRAEHRVAQPTLF